MRLSGRVSQNGRVPAAPTALVSWSHSDPGSGQHARDRRARDVRAFADTLRSCGIDADVDLYHAGQGVDWTRWGPRLVDDLDYVLIVASQGWRAAWEGRGDPTKGTGAAGEADGLRSLYSRNRDDFVRRVRLVLLPGASRDDIPSGLDGVTRYALSSVDENGVIDLLRDLTGQPRSQRPPLGPVRRLPPDPPIVVTPPPMSAETESSDIEYVALPTSGKVQWRGAWDRRATSGPASLAVHYTRLPGKHVPERDLVHAGDRVKRVLRSSGLVPDETPLTVAEDREGITVTIDRRQRTYGEVTAGGIAGLRVHNSGQISVWWPLPADNMGAVLDPTALQQTVAESLLLIASVDSAGAGDIAIAIELNSVTLITDGSLNDLGRRSRATMSGAVRPDLRVEPDEAVRTNDLVRARHVIAANIVPVLLRKWRTA